MSVLSVSPVLWTLEELISHGDDVIYDLALKSAGTLTSYRVLLGRCLLAMEHTLLYKKFGLSGSVNFARQCLGLSLREARDLRRVASELRGLPLLTVAAQQGEISWSQLREVVRKASPDTEELWLELCHKLTSHEIQKLVTLTPDGGVPGDVRPNHAPPPTEYRLTLSPEVATTVERALGMMSKKEGRPLSFAEGVERLFAEVLTKKPYDEVAEKIREEARLEHKAKLLQEEPLVAQAQAIAEELKNREAECSLATQVGHVSHACDATHASETTHQGRSPQEQTPQTSCPKHPSKQASQEFPELTLLSSGGSKLRYNPQARHPSPAQRQALLRRDGRCCRTPGCPNRLWLELHHLKPYSVGGQTLPDNTLTLCTKCHKNVHEGHLKITGSVRTGLIFTDRQGHRLDRIHHLERATWLDFWLGWSGHEGNSHSRRCYGISA
jgi:HNH endonuclease